MIPLNSHPSQNTNEFTFVTPPPIHTELDSNQENQTLHTVMANLNVRVLLISMSNDSPLIYYNSK